MSLSEFWEFISIFSSVQNRFKKHNFVRSIWISFSSLIKQICARNKMENSISKFECKTGKHCEKSLRA